MGLKSVKSWKRRERGRVHLTTIFSSPKHKSNYFHPQKTICRKNKCSLGGRERGRWWVGSKMICKSGFDCKGVGVIWGNSAIVCGTFRHPTLEEENQ